MHNIKCKAEAMFLKNFLDLAVNEKFCGSMLFRALFQYYVLDDTSIPTPPIPQAIKYSGNIFQTIKVALTESLDIYSMTSKDWYLYLLDKEVLNTIEHQDDGTEILKLIKFKAEEKFISSDWERTWQRANLRVLNSGGQSFIFRILHDLHRTTERESKTNRFVLSQECTLCDTNTVDNIIRHSFVCPFNKNAMDWLIDTIKTVDPTVTSTKILLLDFETNTDIVTMACIWIIVESLSFVWARRKQRKAVNLNEIKATLRTEAGVLRSSSSFPNVGRIILNMIN